MPDLSTITPVTREEEFLDRIARAAASPNLPEVDTSDNGDVLTVVSGEWAAAAPASCLPEVTDVDDGKVLTVADGEWSAAYPSAAGFLISMTWNNDDSQATLDKNYNEIIATLSSGIMPVVFDNYGGLYAIGGAAVVTDTYTVIMREFVENNLYSFTSASATGTLTYTGTT